MTHLGTSYIFTGLATFLRHWIHFYRTSYIFEKSKNIKLIDLSKSDINPSIQLFSTHFNINLHTFHMNCNIQSKDCPETIFLAISGVLCLLSSFQPLRAVSSLYLFVNRFEYVLPSHFNIRCFKVVNLFSVLNFTRNAVIRF